MSTKQLNNTVSAKVVFDAEAEDTLMLQVPSNTPVPAAPARPIGGGTGPFAKRGFASISDLVGQPSGDGFPTGDFALIPSRMAYKAYEPGTLRWWLELWPDQGQGNGKPMRFEIVGDVVMGRSMLSDIDLLPYNGLEHGVSRRHALLRPSRNSLYMIDLGSTNGTHYNGIPMGQGIAIPLAHHSVIRLGRLNMTVQYLAMTTV
jgi:hypothetical protein